MQQHTDLTTNNLGDGRLQHGYSYKRAANLIQLPTPQLLAKWENGETTPSLKYLLRLMALYHMNPITMYPKLYKDANDLVTFQKERLGLNDRQSLFINQSNYDKYLTRISKENTDNS